MAGFEDLFSQQEQSTMMRALTRDDNLAEVSWDDWKLVGEWAVETVMNQALLDNVLAGRVKIVVVDGEICVYGEGGTDD